jgi:hypothetical protein
MQKFIAGRAVWPDGWTKLHLYVLPRLDVEADLVSLIGRTRKVIADYPAIVPVADEWLHATVHMIDGVSGADVAGQQRADLTAALRRHLSGQPAFQVSAGPPMANRAGVILDMDGDLPGEPWMIPATQTYDRDTYAVQIGVPAEGKEEGGSVAWPLPGA